MAAFIFFISIKLLSIPNAILFLIESSVKNIFCETTPTDSSQKKVVKLSCYQ